MPHPDTARPSSFHLSFGDPLRIAASLAVVLIHASPDLFARYGYVPTDQWLMANILKSAAHYCVPVFLMLSGAIYLSPAKRLQPHFIWTRAKKLLPTLFFWNAVFAVWNVYYNHLSIDWLGAAQGLLTVGWYYHLYFMYVLFLVYVSTPMVRRLMEKLTLPAKWLGALILFLLTTSLWAYDLYGVPQISWELWYTGNFLSFLLYYLLGHLLTLQAPNKRRPWLWAVLFLLSTGATVVATWWRAETQGLDKDGVSYMMLYPSPLVVAISISFFQWFAQIEWERLTLKIQQVLKYLASLTMTIYFMHPIVLELLRDKLLTSPGAGLHTLGVTGLLTLTGLTFVICCLIAAAPHFALLAFRGLLSRMSPVSPQGEDVR